MADAVATLKQSEKRRREALLRADCAALAPLLAQDLIYVHTSGVVDHKSDVLHKLGSGAIQYLALRDQRSDVWVSGGQGVIISLTEIEVIVGQVRKLLITDTVGVWARTQEDWEMQLYRSRNVIDHNRAHAD